MNKLSTLQKIRACEGEVAAQVLFETYINQELANFKEENKRLKAEMQILFMTERDDLPRDYRLLQKENTKLRAQLASANRVVEAAKALNNYDENGGVDEWARWDEPWTALKDAIKALEEGKKA